MSSTTTVSNTSPNATIAETGSVVFETIATAGAYVLTAEGGMGGSNLYDNSAGGDGAIVTGTFDLVAGTTLEVVVGTAGVYSGYVAGNGGGGSFIYDETTGILLEAAGGGGGGGAYNVAGGAAAVTTAGAAGNLGGAGAGGTGGSGGAAGTYSKLGNFNPNTRLYAVYGFNGGGGGGISSAGRKANSYDNGYGGSGGLTNAQGPKASVALPEYGGGGGGSSGGGGGGGYSGGGGGGGGYAGLSHKGFGGGGSGGGGGSFLATSATNATNILTASNFALNTAANGLVALNYAGPSPLVSIISASVVSTVNPGNGIYATGITITNTGAVLAAKAGAAGISIASGDYVLDLGSIGGGAGGDGADINGGTLELGAGASVTGNISFTGNGGELVIDGFTSPANTITGFTIGDTIVLASVPYVAGDTVTVGTAGIVTIDASGTIYNLNIAGAYVGEGNFNIGGDIVLTESAVPVTIAETGTVAFETIATSGSYILTAEGGMGGTASDGNPGGDGGVVAGTFFITAGTTLEIVVGGAGANDFSYGESAGGGGGGSFIYDENTGILLEAAGGGGGGGHAGAGGAASAMTAGSAGNQKYAGLGGSSGYGGAAGTYSFGSNGGGGGGIRAAGGTSTNRTFNASGGSGGNLTSAKGPQTGVTLPGLGGGSVLFHGSDLGGVGGYGGGGGGSYSGGGGGGYSGGGAGGGDAVSGVGGGGGGGGGSFLATSATNPTDLSATLSSANFSLNTAPNGEVIIAMACFAAGTRILTAAGELIAVESLRVGDALETFDGAPSDIVWIGHRTTDLRAHPRPEAARPIRIAAAALGGGLPWRDLVVSPDHGMYLDGHLIPAKILLNGGNICQLEVPAVTYYHIELAAHAVIFAEGAPAESYLETGNRGAFENEAVTILHPDFAQTRRGAESCAPFVEAGGVVEAVRQKILDRANIQTDFEPELDIQMRDGDAHIISRSAIPGQLQADPRDQRRLGVKIAAITIGGERLTLAHERLIAGWHDVEEDGRWTDGHAVIPAALVCGGIVRVELAAATRYRISTALECFSLNEKHSDYILASNFIHLN